MKSKKEILKKAKEKCPYKNDECAIFSSGFVSGYQECLKDYNLEDE